MILLSSFTGTARLLRRASESSSSIHKGIKFTDGEIEDEKRMLSRRSRKGGLRLQSAESFFFVSSFPMPALHNDNSILSAHISASRKHHRERAVLGTGPESGGMDLIIFRGKLYVVTNKLLSP